MSVEVKKLEFNNKLANLYLKILRAKFTEEQILNAYNLYAKRLEKEMKESLIHSVDPIEIEKISQMCSPNNILNRVDEYLRKTIKIEESNINDIKKEVAHNKRVFNLDQEFLKVYNEYSYYNEFTGEALFYIILSLLSKKRTDINLGNKTSLRLHYFLIQSSGSGKDRGFDFVIDLIDQINKIHLKESNSKIQPNLLTYYEISGAETLEVLLDSYKINKKNEVTDDIIPGILSEYDLLIMRECSFLLKSGSNGDGKQSKRELFLQALEGRPVKKGLVKWEGKKTITLCNACLIGCSRPIEDMKEHMANTGLQQRTINYMRKIDDKIRHQMIDKIIDNSYPTNEEIEKRDMILVNLATKLYTFYKYINDKKVKFSLDNPMDIKEFKKRKMKEFEDYAFKNLKSEQHREIIRTFFGRYDSIINVVALFNCAIRHQSKISLSDYERAYQFLEKSFKALVYWVSSTIDMSASEERRITKWRKSVLDILKKDPIIDKKNFINKLKKEYSQGIAYDIFKQFESVLYNENGKMLQIIK